MFPSVFESTTSKRNLSRLEQLTPKTQPKWGTMSVGQMLAHLNVSYDIAFERSDVKVNGFMRFMLKVFVKKKVVGNTPYGKSLRTAPFFLITDERDFEQEKKALISNIKEVEEKGKDYFEGKFSLSFGEMTYYEWSNLFQKHLDHHFKQFGV